MFRHAADDDLYLCVRLPAGGYSYFRQHTTYLSQLINRRFQTNFFTFVNGYRIDCAIRLIRERQGNITSGMLYTESGETLIYKR